MSDTITRVRAVLGAATPGPWRADERGGMLWFSTSQWVSVAFDADAPNTRAIVLSRNTVEALLDVLAVIPRRHNRQVEDAVDRAEAVLREELERVGG